MGCLEARGTQQQALGMEGPPQCVDGGAVVRGLSRGAALVRRAQRHRCLPEPDPAGGTVDCGLGRAPARIVAGLALAGLILAGRIPLRKAINVLPLGAAMGLVVMMMPLVEARWSVYTLLLLVGGGVRLVRGLTARPRRPS